MKLVVEEPESDPLRDLLARDPDQLASAIVEVEVIRAVRRAVPELLRQALRVVSQVAVVEVSEQIRTRAALLDPATLRSLDAIHLATALEIGADLDGIATYDARMAEAAERFDLTVLTTA